ncbi:glycosyltransferase [Rossellomorea sp. SC111]|uniref:glycosyltransferase n=1 Tax=Rossellomorea sp. SC111 TaxID=2968985 RepID=UPI00215A918B|nr:glycosyltransferase [Rossellomorea sp. SC111]MCR8850568.1 glycosyltransferase [Rossellomorea sp. SC111]
MMKKIIVYYPFEKRDLTSGSSVRPVKLLNSFKAFGEEVGFEIIEIFGSSKSRKERTEYIYSQVDPEQIIYCYMENSTIPIWLSNKNHIPTHPLVDLKFLKYLKKQKIPLGLFYRDIYWKFDELYKLSSPQRQIMQTLFKVELSMYKKYASIFYLPSLQMGKYLNLERKNVYSLPPGGEDYLSKVGKTYSSPLKAIYVGGIHPRYGVYEMLEALSIINEPKKKIELTFIIREAEKEKYKEKLEKYQNQTWLSIKHASGSELEPYYLESHFGIVPIKKDYYNDFAIAVKMFEYLSYGLPMIVSNCEAQSEIVEKANFGIIQTSTTEGFLKGFNEILNEEKFNTLQVNAKRSLLEEHLWKHRVEKIHKTLMELRN